MNCTFFLQTDQSSNRASLSSLDVLYRVSRILQENNIENMIGPVTPAHKNAVALSFEQCEEIDTYYAQMGKSWLVQRLSAPSNTATHLPDMCPTSVADMCGNRQALEYISHWFETWPRHKHALLLNGPPGVGKTTCIELLARAHGYELIEYNTSDQRSGSAIAELSNKVLYRLSGGHDMLCTLFPGRKPRKFLLFMDEVDGVSGGSAKSGLAELLKLIKQSGSAQNKLNDSVPIVMACNLVNTAHKEIRDMQRLVDCVEFDRLPADAMRDYLKQKLGEHPGIELASQMGDMRAAQRYLEFAMFSGAHHQQQQFSVSDTTQSVARKTFVERRFSSVEQLFAVYEYDKNTMPAYAFENAIAPLAKNDVDTLEAMECAADALCTYDVFETFVREQPDARMGDATLQEARGLFGVVLPARHSLARTPRDAKSPFLGKTGELAKLKLANEQARLLRRIAQRMPVAQQTELLHWLSAIILGELEMGKHKKHGMTLPKAFKSTLLRLLRYFAETCDTLGEALHAMERMLLSPAMQRRWRDAYDMRERFRKVYLQPLEQYDLETLQRVYELFATALETEIKSAEDFVSWLGTNATRKRKYQTSKAPTVKRIKTQNV